MQCISDKAQETSGRRGRGAGRRDKESEKECLSQRQADSNLYLWHPLLSLNKPTSDPSTRGEGVRGRHALNFPFAAGLEHWTSVCSQKGSNGSTRGTLVGMRQSIQEQTSPVSALVQLEGNPATLAAKLLLRSRGSEQTPRKQT